MDGVAPDKPLDSAVLSRMKQFSAMNKFKKMALRVNGILFFLLRVVRKETMQKAKFDLFLFLLVV